MHTFTGAIATAATLASLWGLAAAQTQTPSVADFDACNRQARMHVETDSGTGSALPRQSSTGPGVSSTPGSIAGPSASTPGTANPDSSAESSVTTPGTAGSGTAGSPMTPGTSSGAEPDTSTDPTIVGIDPSMRADTLYLATYQDCMRARGY
jgi:hypothetical protein